MSFLTAREAGRINCLDNMSVLGSGIPTFAHAFLAEGYDTILSGRMDFRGGDQRHGFESRLIGDLTIAHSLDVEELRPSLGDLLDTCGCSRSGLIESGWGHTGFHDYDRAVTRTTVEWLETRAREDAATKPFLLTVGFISPHCPFIAPREDYELYRDLIGDSDLPDADIDMLPPLLRQQRAEAGLDSPCPVPREAQRRARTAYYGLCTFVDRMLGKIIDALERTGLSENTIVVYTSDHGEQLGEHGMWWKSTFYEGSVGVPLIISGPTSLGSSRVFDANVSLMDLGPTLLDLVGAPPLPNIDGRSFKCLIDGNSSDWTDKVVAESTGLSGLPPIMRMIKRGTWKLIYYHGHEPQLFDLSTDPDELHDRANDPECSKIKGELLNRVLEGWDPDEIERQLLTRPREIELIGEEWKKTCLPEPDPVWYKAHSVENWYKTE